LEQWQRIRKGGKVAKKVHIDEDECIGCGSCEEICPEVFKLDEETDIALVIKPEEGPEGLIEEAMETCPVECIYWEED
jgi:ferredoxin